MSQNGRDHYRRSATTAERFYVTKPLGTGIRPHLLRLAV